MPHREGQRAKLLALLEILRQETDEEHPLSVPQLVEKMQERGIPVERKTLYTDIEALNSFPDSGFEVVLRRGANGGYYITEFPFELAELKLLVDAVSACKFISARKCRELLKKLGRLVSRYHQEELKRKVLVSGRLKSTDDGILYTVDTLHQAISAGVQVEFQYTEWNREKKLEPRHGGKLYRVSPWVLVWESGDYYLIACTQGSLRHYRVDKMRHTACVPGSVREGAEQYADFDVNTYMQQMFGMFHTQTTAVTLLCREDALNAVLDRFGTVPILVPQEDGRFSITVPVQPSPPFYGWVAGFGASVEISSPPEVRSAMADLAAKLAEQYRSKAE